MPFGYQKFQAVFGTSASQIDGASVNLGNLDSRLIAESAT